VFEKPDEVIHKWKQLGVVGGTAQDKRFEAPRIPYKKRDVRFGNVVHADFGKILDGKTARHGFHHGFSVAIHRGIGDDDAFFSFVSAPAVVTANYPGGILSPNRTVSGTNNSKLNSPKFSYGLLNHGRVLADYIGKISEYFVLEILKIHFVIEYAAGQSSKTTEGIT